MCGWSFMYSCVGSWSIHAIEWDESSKKRVQEKSYLMYAIMQGNTLQWELKIRYFWHMMILNAQLSIAVYSTVCSENASICVALRGRYGEPVTIKLISTNYSILLVSSNTIPPIYPAMQYMISVLTSSWFAIIQAAAHASRTLCRCDALLTELLRQFSWVSSNLPHSKTSISIWW